MHHFGSLLDLNHEALVSALVQKHVKIAGSDERQTSLQDIAIPRFSHFDSGDGVQTFSKSTAETARYVLDDADAGKVAGQLRKNLSQRLRASCGCTEQNDLLGMIARHPSADSAGGIDFARGARRRPAPRIGCGFDLHDEVGRHIAQKNGAPRLQQNIHRSSFQRVQCDA